MSLTNRASVDRRSRATRRGPITVMVVDDERDPRESVCEWLTAKGYTAVPARDGADALRHLRDDAVKPDVILLDLMMPVMNGWQFREEQAGDPQIADIPVIVITANRDTRGIEADDTLFKPVNPEHLLEVVERWSGSTEPALAMAPPRASGATATVPASKAARTTPRRPAVVPPVPPAPFSERLVEMLGHDLRNPLSAIAMTAGLLASQNQTEGVAEPTTRILAIVERMDLMVAHLVEFLRARLGREFTLRREPTDLAALCEKMSRTLTASLRREIDLEMNGTLEGSWDRGRLELLLATLVIHAADRDQSSAPIRVRADGSNPRFVRLEVAHQGLPAVDLSVFSDDVEAECMRLGLGMFVAQHIVRAHGGEIEIETDGTTASRFVIGLPRD
ncbi:MAG TPA: hybrid sensor histidine kinase/response regulator [Candidatus Krumholzibacteria bacterium]|nr:hybrid sensor histidine kinase/response regulator [Candidatus Krumholzibacteria bacterium]